MESAKETAGLRTFASIVFYLLLVFGVICIIVGALLTAGGITEFVSLGWTVIMSGALCILGAFGLRVLLRVIANMADDLQASRELLSEMQRARPAAPQSAPPTARVKASASRSAQQRSGRIPMPASRGTASHPPMPPLRGSSDD